MDANKYIEAYLTGNATDEELNELLGWIAQDDAHKQEFADACRLWYSLQSSKYNSDKAFEQFTQKTSHKSKTISVSFWKRVSAVAAVIVLAIGSFALFNLLQPDTITVTNNQLATKTVSLPDGSKIYLRNGASITYPETFKKNKRVVSASGDLFCEIFHNESAPFTLKNDKIEVKVLGTSFQVNNGDQAFVVVETGKVQVSTDNQSVIIVKGERADLKNNRLETSKNTDINFFSWKTGILQFQNIDLQDVFNDLSRHYNCTFRTNKKNNNLNTFKLTGTYKDLTLEETLHLIELAIPALHYQIDGNRVTVFE
jgi:ferric-dicitrate binding protein FerR (iron transport regulator)